MVAHLCTSVGRPTRPSGFAHSYVEDEKRNISFGEGVLRDLKLSVKGDSGVMYIHTITLSCCTIGSDAGNLSLSYEFGPFGCENMIAIHNNVTACRHCVKASIANTSEYAIQSSLKDLATQRTALEHPKWPSLRFMIFASKVVHQIVFRCRKWSSGDAPRV